VDDIKSRSVAGEHTMLELGPTVVVKGCMESVRWDVPCELLELVLTVRKDSGSKEQQNEEQRTQEGNRTT